MSSLLNFETPDGEEKCICDVKAKTEKDFLDWAKETFFKKTSQERALAMKINGKNWMIVRAPKIGIRVGVVFYDNPNFVKEVERLGLFTVLGVTR